MQIDLTAAAKFYGLRDVPPIVYSRSATDAAAFRDTNRSIYINPDFMRNEDQLTDDYNESRFTNAGAPRLSAEDAARFVIAHELWHAAQLQNLGADAMLADQHAIDVAVAQVTHGLPPQLAYDLGIVTDAEFEASHDQDPFELDADKHAAQAYKLIKFVD